MTPWCPACKWRLMGGILIGMATLHLASLVGTWAGKASVEPMAIVGQNPGEMRVEIVSEPQPIKADCDKTHAFERFKAEVLKYLPKGKRVAVTCHVRDDDWQGWSSLLSDGTYEIGISVKQLMNTEYEIESTARHEVCHLIKGHVEVGWVNRPDDETVANKCASDLWEEQVAILIGSGTTLDVGGPPARVLALSAESTDGDNKIIRVDDKGRVICSPESWPKPEPTPKVGGVFRDDPFGYVAPTPTFSWDGVTWLAQGETTVSAEPIDITAVATEAATQTDASAGQDTRPPCMGTLTCTIRDCLDFYDLSVKPLGATAPVSGYGDLKKLEEVHALWDRDRRRCIDEAQ